MPRRASRRSSVSTYDDMKLRGGKLAPERRQDEPLSGNELQLTLDARAHGVRLIRDTRGGP